MKEMSSLGKEKGFSLLLVFFPMADQLLNDYPNASYPSRVKKIARRYHIPFVDLALPYRKYLNGVGSLFIEWDGHPNARAYNIAAREIKQYLQNHLLNHER